MQESYGVLSSVVYGRGEQLLDKYVCNPIYSEYKERKSNVDSFTVKFDPWLEETTV